MSQPLWYVRKQLQTDFEQENGASAPVQKVAGPFPSPQINEMLRFGELGLNDEVSLDRALWQSIRDSGHFGARSAGQSTLTKPVLDANWQEEREKARLRWQEANGSSAADEPPVSMPMPRAVSTGVTPMDMSPSRGRPMSAENSSRSTSLLIAVLAIVVLALLGGVVWYGQQRAASSGQSIQAGLGLKTANCTQTAAPGVSWSGCNLSSGRFVGANLSNANLVATRFVGADLSGADLTYADLSKANLQRANLENAHLLGANLSGANLSEANLRGADLRYADFIGADIEATQFDGASLVKATWLDGRVCAEGSIGVCR